MAQNSSDVVGLQKSSQRAPARTLPAGLRALRVFTQNELVEERLLVANDRTSPERGLNRGLNQSPRFGWGLFDEAEIPGSSCLFRVRKK